MYLYCKDVYQSASKLKGKEIAGRKYRRIMSLTCKLGWTTLTYIFVMGETLVMVDGTSVLESL
jgi:hypothetical protein